MAASRKHNQASYNIFTGDSESPPPKSREPLRETFRTTLRTSQVAPHTIVPSDPVNEDLRAQINALRYELEAAKQDRERADLEQEQRTRQLETKAEVEQNKAQQAEKLSNKASEKFDNLQREFSEAQSRSENERQDLERRLRASQDKAQQLQEDVDEANEQLSAVQRQSGHKFNTLQTEHEALKTTVSELRVELDVKVNALSTAQKRLSEKEAEAGDLEAEVLRLKAMTGDAETLTVIKRELSDQVAHIKKLESLTREQNAELKTYKRQHKAIEVVEEEKRSLETKVRMMDDLRQELAEAHLRKQVLEDEKNSWTSYLENEAESGDNIQFETPEDLARAFIRERLERADLMNKLGEIKPELLVKEANIQTLEDEKAALQSEIQQLKSATSTAPNAGEAKARARLERQKALATKEVEFLRAQVKAFDDEEREMQPDTYDATKAARVKELEDLIDSYRAEIENLRKELDSVELPSAVVTTGQKRPLESDEGSDERIGELRRKNRQLQEESSTLQKKIKLLESDSKAQLKQLKQLKESSRVRVLELKSNPTADAEALKLSTVRHLREANSQLLDRLDGKDLPSDTMVPLSQLEATRDQLAELTATVASHEKRIKRLKQIWTAKSLEFREAVASILGWKLDFMPNGRVRVTSMFYPGDEETGENSIVFDGENGTMKVSGGEQSAFANEIRDLITFWVEERKEIPCFLAAMTLEFWERTTRAAR
ncbi:mitotic spindle assembly checkpoint protein-like protein MAD1 [Aaosphaeria arxii CBS 175.79]|uniref:Spindle assembly checkpoint component MAD1 n=1 Tax=Aaosphaeria arxii CBS 175.79 TaxID=1450172 RepID=A0A6A5XHS6_9PLEO|nr:mitotic spindle assembly checkpoint protein-like protein MAD1 [Aaosphaeria arxii CBS 175.79]KAF2012330.1 mitotic spindle assembly checkpoint protein-like protein MAD1 [Aaosphaeria arxii CBS 175.79]